MGKELQEWERPKIMIVDDVELNAAILVEIISKMGYVPMTAKSAREALGLLNDAMPQLILLDVSMPEMNGYELCQLLKRNIKTRDIPVIFISALNTSEDKVRGFQMGGVDFIQKPFEVTEVTLRIENYIKIYQMQKELESYNYRLNRIIDEQMKRIEQEKKGMLSALAKVAESRDNATGNHLENVSYNSRILAQALQLSPNFSQEISETFIEKITISAKLHDIGKIQTPDRVLLKTDYFNPEERNIMEQHAVIGAHILEEIYDNAEKDDFLFMAIRIARYHHERWDGTGYPEGLKGKQIPLCARIVGMIDIFDALTGERCYKSSYPMEESLAIMESYRGTYFDPDMLDVFLKIRKQFRHNLL